MAGLEEREYDYAQDGSVDLKGRPVLRSKTGRWRACAFVIGYEMFERLAFVGIQINLVEYLTKELHQGTVTSSNNVTNWTGTMFIMTILGAYVADAYLGRYWTFVISATTYLLGMVLLSLAVSIPALKPPACSNHGVEEANCPKASSLQVGIFYLALYIIAVGNGGTRPNIPTIGVDQFDEFEPKERTKKLSFFNWWMTSILFAALFSSTFLVYLQDNVGWSLGYGLPTVGLAFSIIVFLVGTPFYRHKLPSGSPFTKMAKAIVAALRKWKVPFPDDLNELYELSLEEYANNEKLVKLDHTPFLRFLDKAAVKTESTSPWMLSAVTQVEETKQMIKMIPILLVSFLPNTIIAQLVTLFIKQGTTLDRKLGPSFEIPPASLVVFVTIFFLISLVAYDSLFVPTVRRFTKNPRGITMLQRMGIGLAVHVVVMITATLAERKRLSVVRSNGIVGINDTVPLSIFILLPQFALMGVGDTFLEPAQMEFFYDQAPESMKSLGSSFYCISKGLGFFLSSFILSTVADITKRNGHGGWILNNLNMSRMDYYYAFLAVLTFLNLLLYILFAKFFVYNADHEVKKSEVADLPLQT
ncbi:Proton-dependent oligopeptide transporter [Parasponia andersonii]|uniref:Proton-dependent oligopeptide transporter n=1 Tax=Parasponia andersonii TaxID=3476 RepID=A0A2P5B6B4_PARAD|nr:Proton-dependent oligopeptide transporter [Parasponia andersonii]